LNKITLGGKLRTQEEECANPSYKRKLAWCS